jgi:hypothetical protein
MQRNTIRLFLQNVLHFSGSSFAHHQELKLYIQHRVFVKAVAATFRYGARAGGRKNRLKHAEHFAEINELYNVASC